jgi:two-component system chemotaxis sensor kinase CheA
VDRLEEFPRSALERVGPQQVVQYRNEILPLIDVSRALRQRRSNSRNRKFNSERRASRLPAARGNDNVQVVVYAGNGRRVGLVVDRILDIAEEALVSRSSANRPGVLCSAVIQGRVTEFLDVEGILCDADPDLVEPRQTIGAKA